MKNSKFINNTLFVLLVFFASISCKRKELYYSPQSKLKLITHWEQGIQEKPYYNEAIFYSTNGGKEYRCYIESDTMIVSIPIGEYHVILYNWRTNASAQTVQFRDHHSYTMMNSFTGALVNKSGYFDKYDLYLSPDIIYSWTTQEYEKSKIVAYSSDNDNMSTLHTYPKRVVHDYNFEIEVQGLEYVKAISAVALGFAPQLTMYNKQGIENECGHRLNVKLTKTGFLCNFSAYNHHKPNDQRLHFVIKLPDNSFREFFIDINKELDEKGTIESTEKIIIEYDGPVDPPTTGGGGFDPPEIGDWDGIEEDVVFPSQFNDRGPSNQ